MPEPLTVTRHAMDRYRERVADLSDREIFAALSGPTFELAAELGAPMVKLPTGQHAVLREATVVTILPSDCSVGALDRFSSPPRRKELPGMTRIAFSIHEIARVLAGDQTLFIRPARYSAAKIEVGARLWVAEPFHLEPRFDGKAPTVALGLGAVPAYAADLLLSAAGDGVSHGKRQAARSMCRDWHRAHLIVRSRTELLLQDLTAADLANLGHASRDSFAQVWNVQISEWRRTMKWADNPRVLKFGFELIREPLPGQDLPPLPRERVAVAVDRSQISVAAAKAHADRHSQARKLSATVHDPIDLGPRPVRTVAAPLAAAPGLPSFAERETGQCRRCGSRLAFGCEHHPLVAETAA